MSSKSLSLKRSLAKILLGNSSLLWLLVTAVLVPTIFYTFSMFGKQTQLESIQFENRLAALFFTVAFILSSIGFGTFEREARFNSGKFFSRSLMTLLSASALSTMALTFIFFIQVGRYSFIYGTLGSFFVIQIVFGILFRWLRRYAYRFIILGPSTKLTETLLSWDLRSPAPAAEQPPGSKFAGSRVDPESFHNFDQIIDFFREQELSDVLLSDLYDSKDPKLTAASIGALQSGLRIQSTAEFFAEFHQRYPVEILPPSWALHAGFDIHHPITNLLKRWFDFSLALLLLIILSPVLLLLTFVVWITSRGPAFYLQERRGRFSRPFKMVKFRTMKAEDGPLTTARSDSRITVAGKILRPLHLDELPQLWNILIGEMSFVGPRPEAKHIADLAREYSALYELRHMVRPGLSGLAQIRQGKTGADPDVLLMKLSYDLYYIKNHSLLLDLWIMFRTIFVLARKAW
jgi:lipopolysaccharide/colanic/teichoic acid biosynthesis glycosyltransferase